MRKKQLAKRSAFAAIHKALPHALLPIAALSTAALFTAAFPAGVFGQASESASESSLSIRQSTLTPGQDPLSNPQLLELVQSASSRLDAKTLPQVPTARQSLDQALSQLRNFLASSPSQGPLWQRFLKLDTIAEELSQPTPNLEVLNDIEKTFRQNYYGLEFAQFVNVREALSKYVQSQRFGSNPETTFEILRNRLNKLSERMQSPGMLSDANAMHDLAQTVTYLHQGNQLPDVVSSVKRAFSYPNIRVLASSDFLQRRLTRPVDEANPVNELILGTTILGQSVLRGVVSPQLLDSPSNAAVRLNLNADFASVNRGYNRSVVLNTQGSANIAASESIVLTDYGLASIGDTGVDADLKTVINSIEHRLRLVRKIAAKQAAKQKPLADAIGESRLENRIRSQFHEQLNGQLAEANSKINSLGVPTLSRLGITKPSRNSWSTTDNLAVQWNIQNGVQLAATGTCPLPMESSGVTVQIHQSALGNLLDPILAGRILRSEDMDGYISQFGDAAKGIPRKEEDGPWAITLNGFQPVELHLDDSRIRFRIRTLKLRKEEQGLNKAATIEASYRVDIADGAVQLVRDGDVNVEFSGKEQRGVEAVTLRTFLRNKFEQLFRPELLDKPFRWSERLPDQFRDLQLSSLAIDDGWMQLQLR